MKLYVIQGPALSGKTKRIVEELKRAHRENPLSYTFVGPSGEFVKEFSDWFARRLESSVPRGNFLVIDQLAFKLYWFTHPDQLYVDEDLRKLLITESINSMGSKELGKFSNLRDSSILVSFVAEVIKDVRENGLQVLNRLANDESRHLVEAVLEDLIDQYGEKAFDTSQAYHRIDPEKVRGYLRSRFGGRLFIDGFLNFSRSHMIFLSKIVPEFDEVFITIDPAVMDQTLWDEFLGMLGAGPTEYVEETLRPADGDGRVLESFLNGEKADRFDGGRLQKFEDPEEELIQVCREIKRRIVDQGMRPGDIAVVLNNFSQRAEEFSQKLEEYGVPVNIGANEPLSTSVAMQLLILPFKAALAGYPPETLISMLDHGIGVSSQVMFDLDELDRLAVGAGLYMGIRESSLKDRGAEWRGKLEDHLAALRAEHQRQAGTKNVYEGALLELEDKIGICQDVERCAEEIFGALERIDGLQHTEASLDQFREEVDRWIGPLREKVGDNPDLEDEVLALDRFEEVTKRLEVVLRNSGKTKLRLRDFTTFICILMNSVKKRPYSSKFNSVEVLSLTSARFRHRDLKFIVNFNDGVYPVRRYNPLYRLEGSSLDNYYLKKEKEQKEDLYACLSTSSEAVLTLPKASREGEIMVPSLWIEQLGLQETVTALEMPMSEKELKVEYGIGLARGAEPELDRQFLELVEPLRLAVGGGGGGDGGDGGGFSWTVDDEDVVRSLVGKSLSYTKISEFKGCPYKYFLRRALKLEVPETNLYGLSPLEKGSAYHSCLKILYDWAQEEGKILELDEEVGKIRDVVEEVLQRFVATSKIRSLPHVKRSMVEDVASTLQSYLELEMQDKDKACIGERVLTELPFTLNIGEMGRLIPRCAQKYGDMVLRGWIDRVDINVVDEKDVFDAVVSDYKSSKFSADLDQIKLYSLVMLCLDIPGMPGDPRLMKAFFRIIKDGKRFRMIDVYPSEARMEVYPRINSRKTSTLNFSEVDDELVQTLDEMFRLKQFVPGQLSEDRKTNCYFCEFETGCDGLVDRARGRA